MSPLRRTLSSPDERSQQSELVLRLAENLFGPERVHQLTQPSMVAEDFAYFLEQAPGCMIFLGIGEPERANALHTDTFTFDEEVLFQDQAHGQFGPLQRLKTETPWPDQPGVCLTKPIPRS